MNANGTLIETLKNSVLYTEYERAFSEATGLPLALRPVETWQLPLHGKRGESPFCALMASRSGTCAACLQLQDQLCQSARQEPAMITCPNGLSETAVPVRQGEVTIGFLQSGQVLNQSPSPSQFKRVAKNLAAHGVEAGEEVKEAFFKTTVLSQKRLNAIAQLLSSFAQHLSIQSNQIAIQKFHAEPPVITRAKQYIQDHQTEELSLAQVAKSVNTSVFYFCKLFKKATGVNFTEYVSRSRVEKAKNLLLNPNLRVSEIAYEVGFQSLTHFNRVFKKITGESPTHYREQLPPA